MCMCVCSTKLCYLRFRNQNTAHTHTMSKLACFKQTGKDRRQVEKSEIKKQSLFRALYVLDMRENDAPRMQLPLSSLCRHIESWLVSVYPHTWRQSHCLSFFISLFLCHRLLLLYCFTDFHKLLSLLFLPLSLECYSQLFESLIVENCSSFLEKQFMTDEYSRQARWHLVQLVSFFFMHSMRVCVWDQVDTEPFTMMTNA